MDIKEQIRNELKERDRAGRACYLDEIFEVFYRYSKFDQPGGEGLDGRDGPERRALAKIRDLVIYNRRDAIAAKNGTKSNV